MPLDTLLFVPVIPLCFLLSSMAVVHHVNNLLLRPISWVKQMNTVRLKQLSQSPTSPKGLEFVIILLAEDALAGVLSWCRVLANLDPLLFLLSCLLTKRVPTFSQVPVLAADTGYVIFLVKGSRKQI